MIRFKQFILEYLTPEQDKEWSQYKMSSRARQDTDHFFGKDNDHVREDIKDYQHDKSEIHKKVETHLGKELSHEEYKSGLTNDKYGRQVKLGKMIKDDKLKTEYSNDSSRVGANVKKPYMTIVRGHHVAGQTNPESDPLHPSGHAWKNQSCKNMNSGVMREVIPNEIHYGTVVVRGHDHDGKEIYRATLQPHHKENEAFSTKPIYSLNSEYGIKHPAFTAHAHDVASRLSGEYRPGVFEIHPDVYNDRGQERTVHPGITSEHIDDAIKYQKYSMLSALVDHPKITPKHLDKLLSPSSILETRLKSAFAKHPNMSEDNITKTLKDNDPAVRYNVMGNKNITRKHTEMALKDPNENVRAAAFNQKNKHITPDDITKAIKGFDDIPAEAAVMHPHATPEHITHALNSEYHHLRIAAIQSPNVTREHIDKALDDKNDTVKANAVSHPEASVDHIDKAMNDKSCIVRAAAVRNPKATSKHIYMGLNDKEENVQFDALHNPNITTEHLKHAMHNAKSRNIRNMAEDLLDRRS